MATERPPRPPDPMPLLIAAKEAVDRQLRLVFDAPNRDEVNRHAAILAAWSARESHAVQLLAGDILTTQIAATSNALVAAEHRLTATITDFTTKADKGTNRLATWTMVLAIATLALVAATAGLVYATLRIEPPQIITVGKP